MSTSFKKQSASEGFLENVSVLSSLTKYERFRLAESMKSAEFEDGQVLMPPHSTASWHPHFGTCG